MGGMSASLLPQWSGIKPVIGMVHLMALPGSPRFTGDVRAIRDAALRDAESLAAGGVHGIMMENFGDVPFYPGRVPASVVAHVTAIAAEIRRPFQTCRWASICFATMGKARWPSRTRWVPLYPRERALAVHV
jgi:hypothetical protein